MNTLLANMGVESIDELTEWATFTNEKISEEKRDSKAFLNWIMDHPEVDIDMNVMVEFFLTMNPPDFRLQIIPGNSIDRLASMVNAFVDAMDENCRHERFMQHLLLISIQYNLETLEPLMKMVPSTEYKCFMTAMNECPSPRWIDLSYRILMKMKRGAVNALLNGTSRTSSYQKFRENFFGLVGTLNLPQFKEVHEHFKLNYYPEEIDTTSSPEVRQFLKSHLYPSKSLSESLNRSDKAPRGTDRILHGTDRIPHGTDRIPYGTDRVPHGTDRVPRGTDRFPHTRFTDNSRWRSFDSDRAPVKSAGTPAKMVQQAPDLGSLLQLIPSLPQFPEFQPELACLDPATVDREAKLIYYQNWLKTAPKRLAMFMSFRTPPQDFSDSD